MKVRSIFAGLIASFALLLTSEQSLQADPEFSLNFGTVAPDGTPWSAQLQGIKKRIEKTIKKRYLPKTIFFRNLSAFRSFRRRFSWILGPKMDAQTIVF